MSFRIEIRNNLRKRKVPFSEKMDLANGNKKIGPIKAYKTPLRV